MMRKFYCLLVVGLLIPNLANGEGNDKKSRRKMPASAARRIDYAKDIQPILASRCLNCHGTTKQRGGLRLDERESLINGGDSGPIVTIGKSVESELIKRLIGEEPNKVMPPKGDPLTDDQVSLVRAWIDQGAVWTIDLKQADQPAKRHPHWAFNKPERPALPKIRSTPWVRTPIDLFVLAKLEAMGVSPSMEADRNTEIRRLSLDLLGLPPTAEDVQAFVNDKRSDAYDRLVDKILSSPHFGERWGRHWLDLARYADTDGYEKDLGRPYAWRYRDWVINAINQDKPFNEFTIEQLAGDLLPNATLEQRVATGFHRNTLVNREGGTDPEEDRCKRNVDRVNTTGTVWLGLTVGCAECHTHKYDPITQREYYGMYAFFNKAMEADIPAPYQKEIDEYQKKKSAYETEHAKLLAKQSELEQRLSIAQDNWEKKLHADGKVYTWSPLESASVMSTAGATFTKLGDNSLSASGFSPDKDTYSVILMTDMKRLSGIRLEVLTDNGLPEMGPGRSPNGNFVLSEIEVRAAPKGSDPTRTAKIPLEAPKADFEQEGFPIASSVDGKLNTGWGISTDPMVMHQPRAAVYQFKQDVNYPNGVILQVILRQQYGGQHTIGRFRLSTTDVDRSNIPGLLPERIYQIMRIRQDSRNEKQKSDLATYYRSIDPGMTKFQEQVREHEKLAPVPPKTQAQTMVENPNPIKSFIHIRGDFLRPGAEVEPHTLAVLPDLQSAVKGNPTRLDLARWIVDPKNPLTARVAVNQIWAQLFGRGIVPTLNDFGTRGDAPSHPELLDWLATEFIAKKWSRKQLIREIVRSSVYRQMSAHRPELWERDPKNVFLARQNRFRVDAEVVRDISLSVSGLLSDQIGGPSVRPPQPAGIGDLTYGGARWMESKGPDRYRRGLYTWFQRTSPYPMLMTFDSPDANVCCAQRERSNTPLQALTLLNDQAFVECAQSLAKRIVELRATTAEERINAAYRICLGRDPTGTERMLMKQLIDKSKKMIEASPAASAELVGAYKPANTSTVDSAVWVVVARTMLNLDEFVTRE